MSDAAEDTFPEVTPAELAGWLRERAGLILLDVREPYEFPRARFPDARVVHAPLSELARKHTGALPENLQAPVPATVVVFCHHGVRSAQVTSWLMALGWQEVYNLAGGIDAYARQVDSSIGLY